MQHGLNGLTASQQLANASTKLRRAKANNGVDPVSGFDAEAIINWIIAFPAFGDEAVIAQAKAVLRRHGYENEADSF